MKEGSLLKRTLVTTSLLVGLSAAWITLVSVTAVTVVDRAVSATSGRQAPAIVVAPSTAAPEAAGKRKAPTLPPPARGMTPNG